MHTAVNALVQRWWHERIDPLAFASQNFKYHQRRNAAARRSHTKTTKRKLRLLGITLGNLPRCNTS